MVDYQKFDKIIDSDDEGDDGNRLKVTPEQIRQENEWKAQQEALLANSRMKYEEQNPSTTSVKTKKGKEGNRLKYEYQGRTIYEWEQTLTEVILYIEPPPGVTKKLLDITFQPNHLKVGIKNNPVSYINEDTAGPIIVDDSLWMLADGELVINLQKMHKGETWESALKGQQGEKVDLHTKEELKKQMMLERFQEENPGFDFSNAEFNGQIPDAREFMGGIKYN
eukprot:gene6564-7068_t